MSQVASTALSSSSLATVAWRYRGGLYVGIAVKAAFHLVPGERMVPASAPPIDHAGRHYKGSPARSVVYPGDVVPYRPHADVVLRSRAHASRVGLRLEDDLGRALIDKQLTVDRGEEPVDIVGESTAAGDDNPHGSRDAKGVRVRYLDGRDGPATFAPVSPFAASRTGLPGAKVAGSVGAQAKAGSLVELPDDVEWTVFQSAPVDQRIPFLQGHEHLVMTGLHPDHAELRCQLPDERGFAYVAAHPADIAPRYEQWHPVSLAADLLAVDPEAMTAVMVWRGHLRLEPPELLNVLRVVATVAENFDVTELPSPSSVDAPTPRSAPPPAPFDATSTRTLENEDHAAAAVAGHASPFPNKRRPRPQMSTMGMKMDFSQVAAVPFSITDSGQRSSESESPPPIPGAPWSPVAAAPVEAPAHGDTTGDLMPSEDAPDPFGASAEATAGGSPSVPPAPPVPPAEPDPAPAEEPAPESEPVVIKAEGWKQQAPPSGPDRPRRPSPPPPAPKPPPRPAVVDVKSIVYGRFA